MPSLSSVELSQLGELIASRRPGHSLPGDFYSSELVYRAELDRIWRAAGCLPAMTRDSERRRLLYAVDGHPIH